MDNQNIIVNNNNDIISSILNLIKSVSKEDISYYKVNGDETDIYKDLQEILSSDKFSLEDLQFIFEKFNTENAKAKLQQMFVIDQQIHQTIQQITHDNPNNVNNHTLHQISNNLMKLQYNVILSICNKDAHTKPMYNLIDLISKKIEALNDVYIDKPESEKFKQAYSVIHSNEYKNEPQGGGKKTEDIYYKKYLKYKTKYLQKKNKRN